MRVAHSLTDGHPQVLGLALLRVAVPRDAGVWGSLWYRFTRKLCVLGRRKGSRRHAYGINLCFFRLKRET